MLNEQVHAIQRCYPQIYLACHVDQVRARSTRYRISAQDSTLLAHVDEFGATLAGQLARHLSVSKSTLSAALGRLESLGYVLRKPRTDDRREIELRLTEAGQAAMSATSVLDSRRVEQLLERLSSDQRRSAVAGLAVLAGAARSFQNDAPRRRRRSLTQV